MAKSIMTVVYKFQNAMMDSGKLSVLIKHFIFLRFDSSFKTGQID